MYNSNSFIMRDQVSDVVKSLMDEKKRFSFVKYLSSLSIAAFTVISFTL
jgi:hypothetical protein